MRRNFKIYKDNIVSSRQQINEVEQKNKEVESQRELKNKLEEIINQAEQDINTYTVSIRLTEEFYNNERDKQIKILEKEITDTVNNWFTNKYNFEFKKTVRNTSRGMNKDNSNTYYKLIDTIRQGEASTVCGDGCQQTLGALLSIAFNNVVGCGTLFLDENFNCFSANQKERVPELLRTILEKMQILYIDHHFQGLSEDEAVIYTVYRDSEFKSHIQYSDVNNVLDDVINEIKDNKIYKCDLDILDLFGIPTSNSQRQLEYDELRNS